MQAPCFTDKGRNKLDGKILGRDQHSLLLGEIFVEIIIISGLSDIELGHL